MGDKLNTAEYDKKGRCVRHPAIRLRKKKIFGGWKIIIGHCPECCLDEMRRVRDEIGAETGNGSFGEDDYPRRERRKRKEKKKKHNNPDRERRKHRGSSDSVSEVGSAGHERGQQQGQSIPHRDGESSATGSTAPTNSMDGNASVRSEQHIRRHQHDNRGGRDVYYQQSHQQQQPQRTMVLSMAFTHPQTGQRGTYTGQINSVNHKPDGKGTVYYPNGSIAEGSWANGMLTESEDDGHDKGWGGHRNDAHPAPDRSRSVGPKHHDIKRNIPQGGPRNSREHSAPPSTFQTDDFQGNLGMLDQLGGKRQQAPRGASASLQSYNSRGSSHGPAHMSSSSIPDYGAQDRFDSGSRRMSRERNSGSQSMSGGRVGNGNYDEPRRSNSRRAPPPPGHR